MDTNQVQHEKKILLIEDDYAVRLELRELLEEEGYRVAEAANGREAMLAIKGGFRPHVVLLDLMMPEMDGWEFLDQLNAQGRSVPVVLTTAADPENVPRGLPQLRKPYCVKPLLDLLNERCRCA